MVERMNGDREFLAKVASSLLKEWADNGVSSNQYTAEHFARGLIAADIAGSYITELDGSV